MKRAFQPGWPQVLARVLRRCRCSLHFRQADHNYHILLVLCDFFHVACITRLCLIFAKLWFLFAGSSTGHHQMSFPILSINAFSAPSLFSLPPGYELRHGRQAEVHIQLINFLWQTKYMKFFNPMFCLCFLFEDVTNYNTSRTTSSAASIASGATGSTG